MDKNKISKEEQSKTKDGFILFFPMLIVAAIACGTSNIYLSTISVALTVYEFILLNRFIENFHRHQ